MTLAIRKITTDTLCKMLLILLCLLAWPIAQAESKVANRISVSFINPGKQGEVFWDMVTATMQAAADDLNIELEVLYAERNRVQMQTLGHTLLSRLRLPDYLILVNEEQAVEAVVKEADLSGVNTLLLLNDFSDQQAQRMGQPREQYPHWLGSITPDNYGAGYRMADRIIRAAKAAHGSPVHLLAIAGDKVTPASLLRNEGMLRRVEEDNEVILDRLLYANWNRQEAQTQTQRYLTWAKRNHIKPTALWAANDPIAEGAIEAAEQFGLVAGKDLFIAGLNWSPEGLQRVKEGQLVLTDGGHFLAGAWAMVLVRDHANGYNFDAFKGRIRFPMSAIDQSTVRQYTDQFGDQNWAKVNYLKFSRTNQQQQYQFDLEHLMQAITP